MHLRGVLILVSVNLGQVENLGFDVFKDCPKLTNIILPKTLRDGPGEVERGVFTGTTSLTSVSFEEGTTVIASGILKDCKNITKVAIPNTVTEIGVRAFSNSGITELNLPNSVKTINYYAFENCYDLTKITILDNCLEIGWFNIQPNKETVFNNYNDNLTIYCYKDSKIANYAIANQIKYVYLTRPTIDSSIEDKEEEEEEGKQQIPSNPSNNSQKPTNKYDTTVATGSLPQAGVSMTIVLLIITTIIISVVFYKKYHHNQDIQ